MIARPSIRNNGRSHSSEGGVSAQAVPKSSFPKECFHNFPSAVSNRSPEARVSPAKKTAVNPNAKQSDLAPPSWPPPCPVSRLLTSSVSPWNKPGFELNKD